MRDERRVGKALVVLLGLLLDGDGASNCIEPPKFTGDLNAGIGSAMVWEGFLFPKDMVLNAPPVSRGERGDIGDFGVGGCWTLLRERHLSW